jgi:hypothetical protein
MSRDLRRHFTHEAARDEDATNECPVRFADAYPKFQKPAWLDVESTFRIDAATRQPMLGLMILGAVSALGAVVGQTQDVLGAYFPTWMFCALIALALTAAVRWLLVRAGVDRLLRLPVVVYLALTVALSLGGWLLWLS